MALLTVIFAIGVALGYFALAFVVLPRIDLIDATPGFRKAFRVGGIAFFAGCGLTHTHIAVHAAQNGELVAVHELVFHALQFVGVWVFVYVAVRMIDVRIEVRRKPDDILRARVAQLARSNEDLEQFANVVSHDLQGPLRTAAGFADLLERNTELDDRGREYLQHLKSSHGQMQRLLQGVLRYSRAAGETLEREPVDLALVAEESVSALTAEVQSARAEVVIGDLPTVRGDAVQLGQVLLNLVSNAIKFHGEQPPRVEISAEREGDDWAITVRDHGPGIPEAERERIFEMFERGRDQDAATGTGIGLAVCRKIVARHGGTIRAEAPEGGGTAFVFTLPAPGED